VIVLRVPNVDTCTGIGCDDTGSGNNLKPAVANAKGHVYVPEVDFIECYGRKAVYRAGAAMRKRTA